MFVGEDGVFGDDVFGEDGLEVFLEDFFSGHNILDGNNKNYYKLVDADIQ